MSLTLVTNPVGAAAQKLFAGFLTIEFVFKREDIAVTSVTSGVGGAKINHAGDLSTYLTAGDSVYLYSVGTNYTYNTVGTVLSVVAGEVTIDAPFIEAGTGGYMNYFKNYYVEFQCVNKNNSDINILPFSIESDGDSAGNIIVDVSIVNDLNIQRGAVVQGQDLTSFQEFEVKYRQVYTGSSESFTLINSKLLIVLYATETPEGGVILNQFNLPKIYLGYPAGLCVANSGGVAGNNVEMIYSELDINQLPIDTGTLGLLDQELNGYLIWKWLSNAVVYDNTKYLSFDFRTESVFDFSDTDFAYPDFLTQ